MNDTIVGMENLPNVFINRIQIIQDEEGASKIKVVLLAYDDMENKSWKGRDLNIKVKIVFESRLEKIQALNEGVESLFDQPIFDAYIVSLEDFSISGNPSKYQSFSKTIEYIKPLKENLNVYAACFIDDFSFDNPMFDKFYGPMVAEQIFVGGQLNTLSNYFYYPDTNEEYGGPVHQKPDGSYMEGSEHADTPHKEVVLVSEENYKIQAFNVDFDLANTSFAGRNIGNVSVRSTGRSEADVETGLSAINPLYAASAMTTLQGLTTSQRIDPEFNPPDPVSTMPVATGTRIVRASVDANPNASGPNASGPNVTEPDFNLAPTSRPIQPPPGY